MADRRGDYTKLPPGWEWKYDKSTGKYYYKNYLTKAMQLEDPRFNYIKLNNERSSTESIPMQPVHGSPYHVYPASNFPAVKAFQGPNSSLSSVSASPLLSSKSQMPMEMSSVLRQGSPQTSRMAPSIPSRQQILQETSFSNHTDTDAVVAKINNMFPTASENHIRLLLKKYLKNVFPTADETLLLDILANSDNNVQKASEKLIDMGYTKREVSAPRLSNRANKEHRMPENTEAEKLILLQPKILSAEEKHEIKLRLQLRYKEIGERVILMALESVDYSEDRASQILQIVMHEDESKAKAKAEGKEETTVDTEEKVETETEQERNSPKESCEEPDAENKSEFKSIVGRTNAKGHNPALRKGPNDEILLADYITWNGANPDMPQGRKGLASGTDSSLLTGERNYTPHGHNSELCKGAKSGLAKGSIYSHLNRSLATNVKCN